MAIPDFMPQLRRGAGLTPKEGGCLVQVASFLSDGVSWTDSTPCVNPVLRAMAIGANDRFGEKRRNSLAPFAGALSGTGPGPEGLDGERLNSNLAVFIAERMARTEAHRDALAAARDYLKNPQVGAARIDAHAEMLEEEALSSVIWASPSRAAFNALRAVLHPSDAVYPRLCAEVAVEALLPYTEGRLDSSAHQEAVVELLRATIEEYRRLTGSVAPQVSKSRERALSLAMRGV